MKILLLSWKSFGKEDMAEAFRHEGHEVIEQPFSDKGERSDEALEQELTDIFRRESPDCVFSFNYFPVVSIVCHRESLPYISWIYDSPYVRLYHYSVNYPTNHIYTFDRDQYLEFHNGGIHTVHYLPLAANVKRLDSMQNDTAFLHSPWGNKGDVAFVGSLYTEKHRFYERMKNLAPRTRGYLEGLMAAQKQVYGANFIQSSLTPDVIADMKSALPMQTGADSVESIEYLYAEYVINRQITAEERADLIPAVANRHPVDLYTPDSSLCLPGCTNHGPVDYYETAPYVYRHARINLNISLRSIHSGIPLRAFEVMGAGGFLLTNYQADFMDAFVPDEDFVYFESKADLLEKVDYFLAHEDERKQIAENGHRRMLEQHTYECRVGELLEGI